MKSILYLNLILIVSILFSSCNKPAEGFEIKGHVKGIEDGLAYIVNKYVGNNGGDTLATGKIEDGILHISGRIDEPRLVQIRYEASPRISWDVLVLDNCDYIIESDPVETYHHQVLSDSYYHNNVIRAKWFDAEYQNLYSKYLGHKIKSQELLDAGDTVNYKIEGRLRKKVWSQCYNRGRTVSKNTFFDNSDHTLKALLLEYEGIPYFFDTINDSIISDIVNELSESFHGKLVNDVYLEKKAIKEAEDRVAIGNQFLDFTAYDKNDQPVKFSEVLKENKVVLLEFWASWCGPCMGEIPNIKKAYQKYEQDGFMVFSVSIDQKKEAWLKRNAEKELPWVSCRQDTEKEDVEKLYGITGIPMSFLINSEGKIIHSGKELRGSRLDPLLANVLQ